MGHSLKGDVDLNCYNTQSEDDLKKIYEKNNRVYSYDNVEDNHMVGKKK